MAAPISTIIDQVRDRLAALTVEIGDRQTLTPHDVDRVEELAATLRSAANVQLRPVNPPIAITADGTHIW